MNRIGMFPAVKMIISAQLPSPYPQPRKEKLDSKGTCDRGAQEGKTFENVHEGQPVRHRLGSYYPRPSIRLQFWDMTAGSGDDVLSGSVHPPNVKE